jgi:chromosome segregation ATPase
MGSSFFSRWTGKGDREEAEAHAPTGSPYGAERAHASETLAPGRRAPGGVAGWTASPALEKIAREFEEQFKVLEEARRYLEDRITPFQRHLANQRHNADQALKQLEARVRPLRQYLESQEQNLGRVSQHLNAELRDQFDAFGRYLTEQQRILELATRYLDEKPRPVQRYCEDQQRAVELVYREVEERLEPFGRLLKEQQRLLESIAAPPVLEEFETLAAYMQEREQAFERYAQSAEHRPAELFGELDEISTKYRTMQAGTYRLLAKVLDQTRQSDERFREALRPGGREVSEARPADEPRAEA